MRPLAALCLATASACTGWAGPLDAVMPTPLEPSSCPQTTAAPAPTEAWARTGPWGAPVSTLAAPSSEVVLAGTGLARGAGIFYTRGAAIFRSADRGRTFTRVAALGDAAVVHLLPVPGTSRVWAAVGQSSGAAEVGAWMSDDLGATFARASEGLHTGARVRRLALAAGTPARVYALVEGTPASPGSAAATLYRKDGGGPWTLLAAAGVDPAPGGPLVGVAADPAERDVLWAVDGARLYRSDDGGAQFTTVAGGAALYGARGLGSPRHLFVDPADAAHLVLATREEGLLESADRGASWTQRAPPGVPAPLGVEDVLFTSQGMLVATGGAGLQRVTAQGWTRVGECLLDGVVLSLAASPGDANVVLAGAAGGLSLSLDAAGTFEPAGEGLESVLGRVFVAGAGEAAVAWLASSAGVFRYAPGGAGWDRVGDWGGALAVADVAFAPGGARAYLAIDEALYPGRYGVPDGVLEWSLLDRTVVRRGLPSGTGGGVGGVVADPARPGAAYAYLRGDADASPPIRAGLARAGEGGALLATALTGEALTDTAQFRVAPVAVAPDGTLYAGVRLASGAPALLRSDDGAATAQQVWTLGGWVPHAVAVGPDGAVYLAGAYGGVGVRRSTDRGQSFAPWDEGLPAAAKLVYALGFAADGSVVAGTSSGAHWRAPGGVFTELAGLPGTVSVWSVAVLPTLPRPTVLAATDRGIYWRTAP